MGKHLVIKKIKREMGNIFQHIFYILGETWVKRNFVGGTKDFLSPETLSCYVVEEGALKERPSQVCILIFNQNKKSNYSNNAGINIQRTLLLQLFPTNLTFGPWESFFINGCIMG